MSGVEVFISVNPKLCKQVVLSCILKTPCVKSGIIWLSFIKPLIFSMSSLSLYLSRTIWILYKHLSCPKYPEPSFGLTVFLFYSLFIFILTLFIDPGFNCVSLRRCHFENVKTFVGRSVVPDGLAYKVTDTRGTQILLWNGELYTFNKLCNCKTL